MEKTNEFSRDHYLFIYKRRKIGWEDGLLKYPKSLYDQIAILVENLELLPETSKCWFESSSNETKFYADGIEIGNLTDPK